MIIRMKFFYLNEIYVLEERTSLRLHLNLGANHEDLNLLNEHQILGKKLVKTKH